MRNVRRGQNAHGRDARFRDETDGLVRSARLGLSFAHCVLLLLWSCSADALCVRAMRAAAQNACRNPQTATTNDCFIRLPHFNVHILTEKPGPYWRCGDGFAFIRTAHAIPSLNKNACESSMCGFLGPEVWSWLSA